MITADEINRLVEQYANSKAGKKYIQAQASSGQLAGKFAGDELFQKMHEAAERLVTMIVTNAPGGLSDSMQNIDPSACVTDIETLNDGYVIHIKFPSDIVHRDSWAPGKYPNGVNDILSLFTKGYDIDPLKKRIWGEWHGKRIPNKIHRDPDAFIEKSVNDFIETYGDEYGVVDYTISPDYSYTF
jgi:hypothetical protein